MEVELTILMPGVCSKVIIGDHVPLRFVNKAHNQGL